MTGVQTCALSDLWFGDSKVVDADGNPLVVYHGTGKDFSEFKYDPKKALGIWTSSDPKVASEYADISGKYVGHPSVMPLYLSLKNPATKKDYLETKRIAEAQSEKTGWSDRGARHRKLLQDRGFDGINLGEGVYIAFEPNQIKSAIGNVGTYSPETGDIRFSLRTSFPTAEEAEKAAYRKGPPETPEFKRFFGASKIKEEGRPQVMYHGSPSDFSVFRENKPIFVRPNAEEAYGFEIGRAHV